MGYLPPGTKFDVFRGKPPENSIEDETFPNTLEHVIKVSFDLFVFLIKKNSLERNPILRLQNFHWMDNIS